MSVGAKNKRDAGFSLVELIVVVAIIGVLIGVISITYSIVGRGNAKSFATTLKQTLATARSDTMGRVKDTYDLIVNCNADGTVDVRIGATGTRNRIGTAKIPVKVYSSGLSYTFTPGLELVIQFSKSTGGVKSTVMTNSGLNPFPGASEIIFECGQSAGTHYDVHLVVATGKVYMK